MPDPPLADESLLQAAGKGDRKAFEEIVRRHQTWAWGIAYRFLGDEEEAADLVQDAFIRLLKASNCYRPTAKFTTYFYRIISRLCLDWAKKKKPFSMSEVPEASDANPDAGEAMLQKETAAAVRAALNALAPKQRIAIIFRYFENMNYEEMAAVLETSPKAVERLMARGREHLRAALGPREDFFGK